MDYSSTQTLLAAVEQLLPPKTFLADRYFPTNEATDIFTTDEVLIEYREGSRKRAPFVSPRKNGIVMLREGYNAKSYAPANIAPKRPITVDDLKRKGFGEALFSKLTPDQRQLALILKDIAEMSESIARRRESMAAEVMTTNACVMKHYADKGDEYEEKYLQFYDGDSNPAVYTPSTLWSSSSSDKLGDIYQMIRFLKKKGNAATDVILGSAAGDAFMNDEKVQKLLDLKNYNIGAVDPEELPEGITRLARINIKGNWVDIFVYDESYDGDDGEDTPYIEPDQMIVTAPGAGKTLYGAVTQLEQKDGEMHTYTGKEVPKYVSDAEHNVRTVTLTSCPLLMPKKKNPWIAAKVMQ